MIITLESIGGTGHGNRAWVAEITGTDPKFGLKREFQTGIRDYSGANSKKSRGVETSYELLEGHVYEISAPLSWKSTERYFARIENGAEVKLSKEQVLAHAKAQIGAELAHA